VQAGVAEDTLVGVDHALLGRITDRNPADEMRRCGPVDDFEVQGRFEPTDFRGEPLRELVGRRDVGGGGSPEPCRLRRMPSLK
jgi:hypothetical protein